MAAPTILIVDDDYTYSRLIGDVPSEAGYRVRVAEDGCSALQSVCISRPALVLLDLMLPGLSGDEVLTQLRSGPHPDLPVVVLSANPDAQALLQHGASAILTNPFRWDELLACVATGAPPCHGSLVLAKALRATMSGYHCRRRSSRKTWWSLKLLDSVRSPAGRCWCAVARS
jgi:CheY-like chemotaxis protein